jgi:hypothetical protein
MSENGRCYAVVGGGAESRAYEHDHTHSIMPRWNAFSCTLHLSFSFVRATVKFESAAQRAVSGPRGWSVDSSQTLHVIGKGRTTAHLRSDDDAPSSMLRVLYSRPLASSKSSVDGG